MGEQHRRPLVVGVDETTTGQFAVRWAVEEARRRDCPVRVISAYEDSPPAMTTYVVDRRQPPADLRDRFDDALGYATDRLGRGRVEGHLLAGRPVDVLLDESRTAGLVVVGARARSPIGALVMGSVSRAVAARAACSVVVVHPRVERIRPRVVVGVDSSSRADVALAAAFDAAESRVLPLDILHAWQPYVYFDQVPQDADVVAAERRRREHWLTEKIAPHAEKHPVVPVTTHLVEGRASEQLGYMSETAALVVVGSRGRGAVSGLLLGSVSRQLLRHARGTVMVAREHEG